MKRRTPPWWFNIGLIGVGLALVLMARAIGHGSANAADWLAAMGTVVAVLATLLAAWYVARAYDLEVKREQDRDEQARRGQAELVAAWAADPVFEAHFHPDPARNEEGPAIAEMRATVWNASFLPVYDLRVDFSVVELDAGGHHRSPVSIVAGGRTGTMRLPVLPPSYQHGTEVVLDHVTSDSPLYLLDEEVERARIYVQVAIAFRDAGNREWERDTSGKLTPVGDTPT